VDHQLRRIGEYDELVGVPALHGPLARSASRWVSGALARTCTRSGSGAGR
jgi:hypothetical protein